MIFFEGGSLLVLAYEVVMGLVQAISSLWEVFPVTGPDLFNTRGVAERESCFGDFLMCVRLLC